MLLAKYAAVVFLLLVLLCGKNACAQAGFQEAHEKFEAFWNNALHARASGNNRQALRQEADALPGFVESRISVALATFLGGRRRPTGKEVAAKLSDVLTDPTWNGQPSVVGVVELEEGKAYAVSYDVLTCAACSSSWFGIFRLRGDRYVLEDQMVNSAPNQTMNLAGIEMDDGRREILQYGVNWGDAHSRLQVRLYEATDKLSLVWSKLNLAGGEIKIDGDKISLTYRSSTDRSAPTIESVYQIRGKTLELVKTKKLRDD